MTTPLLERLRSNDLPLDFNWNHDPHPDAPVPHAIPAEPSPHQIAQVRIVAEDLRDGLHGTSVYPGLGKMTQYLQALRDLGIDTATVGFYPGTDDNLRTSIDRLLREMRDYFSQMTPTVLCLASQASVAWIARCKQINPLLEAIVFQGAAPSRLLVEEWTKEGVLSQLAWAVEEVAHRHKTTVIAATEHTTQTPPEFLRDIIKATVEHGAKRFCIADTIGVSRPVGMFRLVSFVRRILTELQTPHVGIDWHGHRDLGNDVPNALTAVAAGADRVHTVARGIGERAGNTQLEALLLNFLQIMREAGRPLPWKLTALSHVLALYDDLVEVPPPSYGCLGKRALETSLGIHTAAMLKAEQLVHDAEQLGDTDLTARLGIMARSIYSAVDPHVVGAHHVVHVGPWSGKSTVRLAWHDFGRDHDELSPTVVERVLTIAKHLRRELSQEEFLGIVQRGDTPSTADIAAPT